MPENPDGADDADAADPDIDPDLVDLRSVPPPGRPPRPAYRDVRLLALVWAGGAVGTLIRFLIEAALPPSPAGWPWATFLINVTGSFALGFLLEFLARRGPDAGWRRTTRLAVGTGVLGGYTTYSTFAVEIAQRTTVTPYVIGPAYAIACLLLGPLAAAAGYVLARRGGPARMSGTAR